MARSPLNHQTRVRPMLPLPRGARVFLCVLPGCAGVVTALGIGVAFLPWILAGPSVYARLGGHRTSARRNAHPRGFLLSLVNVDSTDRPQWHSGPSLWSPTRVAQQLPAMFRHIPGADGWATRTSTGTEGQGCQSTGGNLAPAKGATPLPPPPVRRDERGAASRYPRLL
jgi:hypothetical protein